MRPIPQAPGYAVSADGEVYRDGDPVRCSLTAKGYRKLTIRTLAESHLLFALSWRPRLIAWILPAGWGSRMGRPGQEIPREVFDSPGYGCPAICPMEGRDAYGGPGREARGNAQTDNALFVWAREDALTPRFRPRRIPLK